jgi:hypothetical protein
MEMAQRLRNMRRRLAEAASETAPTAIRSRRAGPGAALAALLLLAACAAKPGPAIEAAALASPDAPAAFDNPAPARAKPADPEAILGLAPDALERLLGRPELVRRDAPAEVWQYRSASCVVDLYLYPERASYRVAYIEARDRSAAGMTPERCFDSLAKPSI